MMGVIFLRAAKSVFHIVHRTGERRLSARAVEAIVRQIEGSGSGYFSFVPAAGLEPVPVAAAISAS